MHSESCIEQRCLEFLFSEYIHKFKLKKIVISFSGSLLHEITALDLTIIVVTETEPLSCRDLVYFVQILPFRQVFGVVCFPFSFLLFIKMDHDFYHCLSFCKHTTLISKGIFLPESYGNPQPTHYWFSFPFECQF